MTTRDDVLKYVYENYGTKSEKPWANDFYSEVLRQKSNNKWYGVIMRVQKNKVGLSGEEFVDILNVKCEPEMVATLISQKGLAPAYHMNKTHWITIILDGTVPDNEIYSLLDISYGLTCNAEK